MIAAQPHSAVPYFKVDDFPSYFQGRSASVLTRTTVDLSGRPQICEIEVSSGEPKLDKHTCDIIMKRARFEPARWLDGTAALAVVRMPVRWASDETLTTRADIELSVNRLPPRFKSPVHLRLLLAVDAQGKIVDCASERLPASEDDQQPTSQLIDLSCAEARRGWSPIPAPDSSGAAQRSIQNVSVRVFGPKDPS